MSNTFVAKKLEDLDEIANQLIEVFASEKKIVFFGKMGAGKTTLIKAVCKALNVEDIVSSPTFSVVNEYKNKNGESLYHFDFYRIEKKEELYDLGLEEYLDSGNYCFIEWPEKANGLLDGNKVEISITTNKESRIIKVNAS